MRNFSTFLSCILTFLIIQITVCILDPAHFSQQLNTLLPKQVVLLHQDLGRTVNGYNIMAYGLTAIPGLPHNYELKDISYYPSSLIVSYMHGTDENAVNLLFGYIVNILRMYDEDYYVQTVLKTGIIWFVPFLSIDAFELANKKHKESIADGKLTNQSKLVITSVKNMNKFPDKNNQIICDEKDSSKSTGVNLNYNFLKQKGAQFNDICNDQYAGPAPFSQKQTLALKKFMESLNINLIIDMQIGDDVWVYPSKKIWNTPTHKYKFLYSDTIGKLTKSLVKLEQQMGQVIQEKQPQKLGSPYTGGFINWAAAKNIFCFKYLITSENKGQRLQKSVASSFSVLHMLIKKNAPIFNKYRSEDSSKLYIQPICLQQFTVKLEIVIEFGETVTKQYVVPVGTLTQISLKISEDSMTIPSLSHRGQPAYHLYILNTFIAQVLSLQTIPLVSELPPELLPVSSEQSKQVSYVQVGFIFVILGIAGAAVLYFVLVPSKHEHKHGQSHRKMYDIQQEESTRL